LGEILVYFRPESAFKRKQTWPKFEGPPRHSRNAVILILSPMAGAATPSRSAAPSSRPVRVVLRVRLFLPSEATSAAVLCVSLLNSHLGGEVTVQFMGQHTRYASLAPIISVRVGALDGTRVVLALISDHHVWHPIKQNCQKLVKYQGKIHSNIVCFWKKLQVVILLLTIK
jgi:hypothetical protein